MTRIELLRLVIGRARSNGFEFRRWYTARLNEPWIDGETALKRLDEHRRYYALLFSHEFAQTFWKPGSEITFLVEAQTFQRRMPDGTIGTVRRKPFTRRSARRDAWRFHLKEMAASEEPLRYIRRYLHVVEETDTVAKATPDLSAPTVTGSPVPRTLQPRKLGSRGTPLRPLPKEPPAFLRRPYGGQTPGSGPA